MMSRLLSANEQHLRRSYVATSSITIVREHSVEKTPDTRPAAAGNWSVVEPAELVVFITGMNGVQPDEFQGNRGISIGEGH